MICIIIYKIYNYIYNYIYEQCQKKFKMFVYIIYTGNSCHGIIHNNVIHYNV